LTCSQNWIQLVSANPRMLWLFNLLTEKFYDKKTFLDFSNVARRFWLSE